MSKPFAKPYNPKKVEAKIYQLWEKSGYFNPDALCGRGSDTKGRRSPDKLPAGKPKTQNLKPKTFTIIMPPPNANGSLHIGHAVFVTLQDIMIRYHRMKGDKTLWLPGADHAGFETQVVYDKKLEREGHNRFKIPRDQLYQEILDFTLKNKKIMENQLRKLGASCDWSREKFTLDEDIIKKTQDSFIDLYKKGRIYRGERLVNWCTKHQTSLSELEVVHEERQDPLYYVKYGPVTLATVRLETKFGDTAVAVNPSDKHYKKLIGKEIEIETIIGKSKIKVIADAAVDPKFGTGVVKVTPAHDQDDFEIWQRHKNEISGPRVIIDQFGRLDLNWYFPGNEQAMKYHGLKVLEARKLLAEEMAKQGLIVKVDNSYKHNVVLCYKCKNIIEPRLMPQWFVKMKPLAEKAIKAVEQKKIEFVPNRFKKVYFHWMKNIRDWNISRQILWGIPIPAWFCMGCGDVKFNPKIKGHWFMVRHGETEVLKEKRFQGYETPLNETGRLQAKRAAEQLRDKKVDLIISSDMVRCRETAEIIAKELKIEMILDKGLSEKGVGILEGTTLDERSKKFGESVLKSWKGYDGKPPEGESFREMEKRVMESFSSHRLKHSHKNIVVVTHGGPIRVIRKNIKNLSFEDSWKYPTPQNTEIMELILSEEKCKKCGVDLVEKDPDVFDTWFSSGQWPYLALGYPNSKDYKTFYPTDVMETAWDILFFWVARMIMLGIYVTGKVPFKYVYLHGLVRDKDRQKMSKSKGNVIDPLGVIDLYGADALRMALVVGNTPGNDPIIYEEKIRGYRNFANKIWQASRFVLMNTKDFDPQPKPKLTDYDKKKLKELESLKKEITKLIESFKFYAAAEKLYHYFWHTFADKIIESTKPRLKGSDLDNRRAAQYLLLEILKTNLKLFHPFMPFITEEIYQNLPVEDKKLLMIEKW